MKDYSSTGGQVLIIQINKDELKALIQESVRESVKSLKLQALPQEDKDPLLKIQEVCDLLQVSKVTIHHWKKTGRIPFHRISNRIFFKKSEILESLKKIDLQNFKNT